MASGKTVIAFDLYGTLLSTESIAEELSKHFGKDKAKDLAALWRRYQLEYTWRLNSMGIYRPFSDCTEGALQHAAAEMGLSLSPSHVPALMRAYNSLHTFPEVARALEAVAKGTVDAYIFSNGTNDMVNTSVKTSPDLKPHAEMFKDIITVDEVEAFKPAKSVYTHLLQKVGKTETPGSVWVVSANPFDVVGSKAAGLRSAWIDRAGTSWVDALGDVVGGLKPDIVVNGVDKAVSEILGGKKQ